MSARPDFAILIYPGPTPFTRDPYRDGQPFGTWQDRFVDWFRDLGFLAKPGVETKAAKDVEAHVIAPPPPARGAGRGGRGRGAGTP